MSARGGPQIVASLTLGLVCAWPGIFMLLLGVHLGETGHVDAARILGLGAAWLAVSLAWIIRGAIIVAERSHAPS